jgi:hypothetical protein
MQSQVGSIRHPMLGPSATLLPSQLRFASSTSGTTIPLPLAKGNLARVPLASKISYTHDEASHVARSSIIRHHHMSVTTTDRMRASIAAASATAPPITEEAAWDNLASWINNGGGDANDLSLRYFNVGGGFSIRGLASEKAVQPGEELLTVPLSLVISDVALASAPPPYPGAPW